MSDAPERASPSEMDSSSSQSMRTSFPSAPSESLSRQSTLTSTSQPFNKHTSSTAASSIEDKLARYSAESSPSRRSDKSLSSRFSTNYQEYRASCNLPEVVPEPETRTSQISDDSRDHQPTVRDGPPRRILHTIEDEGLPEVVVEPQPAPAPVPPPASEKPMAARTASRPEQQAPMRSMMDTHSYARAPSPIGGYRNSGVETVTPLDKLGDEPDMIQCPFCFRRTETKVDKKPSSWTHLWGLSCLGFTIVGAVIPYILKWSQKIEHYCSHCGNKVMRRMPTMRTGQDNINVYGAGAVDSDNSSWEKSTWAPARRS